MTRHPTTAPSTPPDPATSRRRRARVGTIRDRRVTPPRQLTVVAQSLLTAPRQLTVVAQSLLTALINHEHQHDRRIGEVRSGNLGHALPDRPRSDLLTELDRYIVVCDPPA